MPAGISIGVTNFVGTKLVQRLIPMIGLHSRARELKLKVFIAFAMGTLNLTFFMIS